MSQLDDKINSLSSDELDILNSDPKMLSDFKTKYSQPPSTTDNILGAVGSQLKSSLLPNTETAIQPLSGSPTEQLKQALSPTEGLSRMGQTLREPSVAAGNVVEKFGEDINAPITGKIGGFMAQTALDPLIWAGMKTNLLPESVEKQVPNLLEKMANLPTKATELGGFNEPTPTQAEIEKAVGNVTDTVKQVWKEHGDLLNKAKAGAEIPQNEQEVADSIRKYGNPSNLDIGKPLTLPEHYTTKAPIMEEAPTRELKVGDKVTATHPTEPPVTMTYKMPGMMVGMNDPGFDLHTPVKNPNATWSHPVDSTLSKSTLESYGYKVPDAIPDETFAVDKTGLPMPYKIGPHDTPEQLMTEINRFKSNTPYISQKDQVKAAHYFQDQITQQGVFKQDTAKGIVNGTLKSQYGDLSNIMQTASPELKAAKGKMADLYDTMDEINKKISGSPGEAEAYLRKLFTSKSPEVKDDLKALTKIEQLSGKPVMTELFKKFAGESYGQLLGESVHTIFQAPYAALTSPKLVMTPLAKYGPTVLKTAKLGALGAAERGLQQPFNTSEMQSLKDRLNNAK